MTVPVRLGQTMRQPRERIFCFPNARISFIWPSRWLGKVHADDTLDDIERGLFQFYADHRDRYRTAFDVGACIGLHTVVLAKLGYQVTAFEPDPQHTAMLEETLVLNGIGDVEVYKIAMGTHYAWQPFVRVVNNTTASHLKGVREAYGPLTEDSVLTAPVTEFGRPDLLKLDVEGAETAILESVPPEWWDRMDAIVEVHGVFNAGIMYDYAHAHGLNIFGQTDGWGLLGSREEMPTHHSQGAILVSKREEA